ncbi:hypothetical protein J2125_001455 [Erwinia toletana]|uniref:Uncharacterized protein n=1 Tax=Winslowiella toletana TaxID=92490 RepID=A0ABS4P6J2_9GAMM|nr:hypothetical protein [Winslowiella toletana]
MDSGRSSLKGSSNNNGSSTDVMYGVWLLKTVEKCASGQNAAVPKMHGRKLAASC